MPLTSKQLIDAGIKPGELFGRILRGCKTIEEAIAVWQENRPNKVNKANQIIEGSAWHFLISNPCLKNLPSIEFHGVASNSEKRRWLTDGAVIINGEKPSPNDIISFPISNLVFFPNSEKMRRTMV